MERGGVPLTVSPGLGRARIAVMVASLALGWTVLHLDRSLLFPLLPLLGEEFVLSGAQRGLIASLYFFIYVALQIPSGLAGDRVGLKRVLVVMYGVIGVGLLAMALLSRSYPLLLMGVAVQALGAGAYYSCSYGLTVRNVPLPFRGLGVAFVTLGMVSGSALGLSLAALLAGALGSWRLPFLLMAVPTFGMALWFGWAVPAQAGAPQRLGGFGSFFRERDLVALAAAGFCLLYSQWVVLTWAPSFLFHERHIPLEQAGLFTAITIVSSGVGAMAWGRLSDRVGRKRLLLAVSPAMVAAVLLVAFAPSKSLLVLGLVLFGLTGGLALNPLIVAWGGDLAAGKVGIGTAIATLNAAVVGGSIVAPALSGWLLDRTGSLEAAFLLAAGVGVLGLLLCLLPREAREAG